MAWDLFYLCSTRSVESLSIAGRPTVGVCLHPGSILAAFHAVNIASCLQRVKRFHPCTFKFASSSSPVIDSVSATLRRGLVFPLCLGFYRITKLEWMGPVWPFSCFPQKPNHPPSTLFRHHHQLSKRKKTTAAAIVRTNNGFDRSLERDRNEKQRSGTRLLLISCWM